ncbi:MAG: hypothetical protein CEN91_506, partial [Candidatus Berkelbacteria bacterium Licking1014_85]
MLSLILASFFDATATSIDKFVINRKGLKIDVFLFYLFFYLFISAGIMLLLFGFHISTEMFSLDNLILFVLMILIAITWNWFYFRGLKSEKLEEFESWILFAPLLTIIFSILFFNFN